MFLSSPWDSGDLCLLCSLLKVECTFKSLEDKVQILFVGGVWDAVFLISSQVTCCNWLIGEPHFWVARFRVLHAFSPISICNITHLPIYPSQALYLLFPYCCLFQPMFSPPLLLPHYASLLLCWHSAMPLSSSLYSYRNKSSICFFNWAQFCIRIVSWLNQTIKGC